MDHLYAEHDLVGIAGRHQMLSRMLRSWNGTEGSQCGFPLVLARFPNNHLFLGNALVGYLPPWITQHVNAARNHCFPKGLQRNTFGIQRERMATLPDLWSVQREQGMGIIDFSNVSHGFQETICFNESGLAHHGAGMLETR